MSGQKLNIYGTMRVGDAQIGIAIEKLAEVVGPLQSLSPIMRASKSLLGGLDLRGDLIPVLDPAVICGTGRAAGAPRFAVILRHQGRLVGIGTDEIHGLAQVADDQIRRLESGSAGQEHVVLGGFLENGQVTTVIDVEKLFDREDVLCVAAKPAAQQMTHDSRSRQMLIFEAGGVLFSVLATEVFGTVPRQAIVQGSMTGGICLGTITYHDRRIPVVSTVTLLGLGRARPSLEAEVVVLRFPGDRLLGLAVDAIKDIESFGAKDFTQSPDIIGALGGFLPQVRIGEDGVQNYILDMVSIWQDARLTALADLSDPPPAANAEVRDAESVLGAASWRERYLLFEAGEPKAVPLSHVVKIIPRPRDLTPLSAPKAGVTALFAHGGHAIPLVSLSTHPEIADNENLNESRVLLVGEPGQQIGFVVDRVKSIEISDWTHEYQTGHSSEVGSLVQLGVGSQAKVFECVDLRAEAARYRGVFNFGAGVTAETSKGSPD